MAEPSAAAAATGAAARLHDELRYAFTLVANARTSWVGLHTVEAEAAVTFGGDGVMVRFGGVPMASPPRAAAVESAPRARPLDLRAGGAAGAIEEGDELDDEDDEFDEADDDEDDYGGGFSEERQPLAPPLLQQLTSPLRFLARDIAPAALADCLLAALSAPSRTCSYVVRAVFDERVSEAPLALRVFAAAGAAAAALSAATGARPLPPRGGVATQDATQDVTHTLFEVAASRLAARVAALCARGGAVIVEPRDVRASSLGALAVASPWGDPVAQPPAPPLAPAAASSPEQLQAVRELVAARCTHACAPRFAPDLRALRELLLPQWAAAASEGAPLAPRLRGAALVTSRGAGRRRVLAGVIETLRHAPCLRTGDRLSGDRVRTAGALVVAPRHALPQWRALLPCDTVVLGGAGTAPMLPETWGSAEELMPPAEDGGGGGETHPLGAVPMSALRTGACVLATPEALAEAPAALARILGVVRGAAAEYVRAVSAPAEAIAAAQRRRYADANVLAYPPAWVRVPRAAAAAAGGESTAQEVDPPMSDARALRLLVGSYAARLGDAVKMPLLAVQWGALIVDDALGLPADAHAVLATSLSYDWAVAAVLGPLPLSSARALPPPETVSRLLAPLLLEARPAMPLSLAPRDGATTTLVADAAAAYELLSPSGAVVLPLSASMRAEAAVRAAPVAVETWREPALEGATPEAAVLRRLLVSRALSMSCTGDAELGAAVAALGHVSVPALVNRTATYTTYASVRAALAARFASGDGTIAQRVARAPARAAARASEAQATAQRGGLGGSNDTLLSSAAAARFCGTVVDKFERAAAAAAAAASPAPAAGAAAAAAPAPRSLAQMALLFAMQEERAAAEENAVACASCAEASAAAPPPFLLACGHALCAACGADALVRAEASRWYEGGPRSRCPTCRTGVSQYDWLHIDHAACRAAVAAAAAGAAASSSASMDSESPRADAPPRCTNRKRDREAAAARRSVDARPRLALGSGDGGAATTPRSPAIVVPRMPRVRTLARLLRGLGLRCLDGEAQRVLIVTHTTASVDALVSALRLAVRRWSFATSARVASDEAAAAEVGRAARRMRLDEGGTASPMSQSPPIEATTHAAYVVTQAELVAEHSRPLHRPWWACTAVVLTMPVLCTVALRAAVDVATVASARSGAEVLIHVLCNAPPPQQQHQQHGAAALLRIPSQQESVTNNEGVQLRTLAVLIRRAVQRAPGAEPLQPQQPQQPAAAPPLRRLGQGAVQGQTAAGALAAASRAAASARERAAAVGAGDGEPPLPMSYEWCDALPLQR